MSMESFARNQEFFCSDCPRGCGALRSKAAAGGFCRSYSLPAVARAAAHFGEEPCISGVRGSGAVFFAGCSLRCVFCQNYEISRSGEGERVSVPLLREILLRLRDTGVHNINLVTASHFVRPVAEALSGLSLGIPVVWNSSGYESVETLRMLEGLVQVYLPDYKYADAEAARKYSAAPDYPEAASAALQEMFRQRGSFVLDGDGMLQSGVLIRHLILPGNAENSMNAIDFVADTFPRGSVLFSLMSQYTPMPGLEAFPELQRRVSAEEYELLLHYLHTRRLENGFWQELSSATGELIPAFDGTGVGSAVDK